MSPFEQRNGRLHAEGVDLTEIAARFGTPCYVYSRAAIEHNWRAFDAALDGQPHLVCYAVKANGNLAVLDVLARCGAGFDIVSAGELERVVRAGGDPARVIFSGVGKTQAEMARALEAGVRCFNVESEAELERLNAVARASGRRAHVGLRVNPDVAADTHDYISTGRKQHKFGIDLDQVPSALERLHALDYVELIGVGCHIGSQLLDLAPFEQAARRMRALIEQIEAAGHRLRHVDLGGGLGVRYRDESPPAPADYARVLREALARPDLEIILEPGRAIVANAGVLLARVIEIKPNGERRFVIVDAAMNDLLRPALYGAWHEITPVVPRTDAEPARCDVVGPVCETGDFLGTDRALAVAAGDLIAVHSAGAYGFVMSSNYNARPRAAEVMVDGAEAHLVRAREPIESLWAGECTLPG